MTEMHEPCWWCGEREAVYEVFIPTPLQPEGELLPTCEACYEMLQSNLN